MKTIFAASAFLLILSVPPAARARGDEDHPPAAVTARAEHHHAERGGEPWENSTVSRSVRSNTLALACALGGLVVFTVAARLRLIQSAGATRRANASSRPLFPFCFCGWPCSRGKAR